MTGLAHMLLGAMLVAVGVLAGGLADRLRGIHHRREFTIRPDRARRAATASFALVDAVEPETRSTIPTWRRYRARDPRAASDPPDHDGADDVIAALVAAGYNKRAAAGAVQACDVSERGSLEDWTRAALRRSRVAS
jgi:hypothetical protein